jgi:aryl-alcohol dehydrogenase-like predicted oxidoreductase
MEKTTLPGTSLKISRLGLGGIVTKSLSPTWVTPPDFRLMLDVCTQELGINYIDTAEGYVDAEETIGDWLDEKGSQFRSQVVLGTKVRGIRKNGELIQPLTRENVVSSLEKSLIKLRVEQVEIFWMHGPDKVTPFEETFRGFEDCIQSGKTRFVGICNVSREQIAEILSLCDKNKLVKPVTVQNNFSLLTAHDEMTSVQKCVEENLGFMAFSPLAGGILTGRYNFDQPLPKDSRWSVWSKSDGLPSYWNEKMFAALRKLDQQAKDLGVSLAGLSLAWTLNHPHVTTTLLGPRIPNHLEAVRQALRIKLSDAEYKTIHALFLN